MTRTIYALDIECYRNANDHSDAPLETTVTVFEHGERIGWGNNLDKGTAIHTALCEAGVLDREP